MTNFVANQVDPSYTAIVVSLHEWIKSSPNSIKVRTHMKAADPRLKMVAAPISFFGSKDCFIVKTALMRKVNPKEKIQYFLRI